MDRREFVVKSMAGLLALVGIKYVPTPPKQIAVREILHAERVLRHKGKPIIWTRRDLYTNRAFEAMGRAQQRRVSTATSRRSCNGTYSVQGR